MDVVLFLNLLDDIDNVIDSSFENSFVKNNEKLEDVILNYLDENYSFLKIQKGDIITIAKEEYKIGNNKYKANIKFIVADIKYKLEEDESEKLEITINDGISKLNTLFSSIELGSNINYLDYIKNTLGRIMKYLVEKSNGSMGFAKNSMQVRIDIEEMIGSYYLKTMEDYGKSLKSNFGINKDLDSDIKLNF